jgi:hypothetical protein
MPKLSGDSLKKMFVCQYCGKPFRTRQGLSGHIQWKHSAGTVSQYEDVSYLTAKANEWEKYGELMSISVEKTLAQQNILINWFEVSMLCKQLGIKLGNTDFKNYLVTALAHINASHSK